MAAVELTVHGAFISAARSFPRKTAIVFDGRPVTYQHLEHEAAKLANVLREGLGLRSLDRVGLLMANRPEFVSSTIGISQASLVLVPVPVGATGAELVNTVAHSEMRALLTERAVEDRIPEALTELREAGVRVLSWDHTAVCESLAELLDRASMRADYRSEETQPFFIGYSSGTTGKPKGIEVSQRSRTLLMMMFGAEYGSYTSSDISLATSPMYHGGGLSRGLTPLIFGATVLLYRRFDAEAAVAQLDSGEVSNASMVPTMYDSLLQVRGSRPRSGRTLTFISFGSALSDELKQGILERWPGVRLFATYGSTEAGTVTNLKPEDQMIKSRSVGKPVPLARVRLMGPNDEDVPLGEAGELVTQSPYMFTSYFKDEALTASAFREGFVTAGDLARTDEDGYLYIVGRKSEMILTGGVNVYPAEVENLLAQHPAVREVAVVGIPDPRWGERIHAVIVPREGVAPSEDELKVYCERFLSKTKVPKSFEFAESLPRGATGKVMKSALAAAIATRGSSSKH